MTGCTPISDGCKNCYASKMARRLQAMGQKRYQNGFQVTLHPDLLDEPMKWKKPRMVFVNSMGDMFHEKIPLEYIQHVFQTMVRAERHIFQVLTKRSSRMIELAQHLPWPKNVWLGVTIESAKYCYRADNLRKSSAKIKFLSIEPMIGPFTELSLVDIDWVIVGGESGPQARAIEKEWPLAVRDKCVNSNVPFFFKQWGGRNKKKAGRLLEGQVWDQFPSRK
ncbi:MAG: phage Gp37/Gp68 family protein [Desulforhopalus sp.]|nr:phage Gp37/Gp68 family protein [Desulforhopalus sp.]